MASEIETFFGSSNSLARLLDFGAGRQPLWESGELEAILQHQMDAPLEPDLARTDPAIRRRLPLLTAGGGEPLRTFADLFRCPRPPVELLEAAKRFAKYSRVQAEESLPADIATVLYFLAIAAALTKCDQRITALDDESLRRGFAWSQEQTWLDENSRAILEEADRLLDRKRS